MLADRVLHTTTTTGTGSYDLIDPTSALYLSAVNSVGTGNQLIYAVEFGTSWEICRGVVTAGSPATLTRNLIRSSTGALINWGAGTKTLYSVSQADVLRFGGRGSLPASAGTANAQTLAHITPARSILPGMEVVFVAGLTNTGPTSLSVDGMGASGVLAPGGAACVGGELRAGVPASAVYDGSSWRLVSYAAPPTPQNGAGVGQFVLLAAAGGASLSAPAGGTWLCLFMARATANNSILSTNGGVVAGGTLIASGAAGTDFIGWAWRIA